jgi:broad specificity phosphatase PhoE
MAQLRRLVLVRHGETEGNSSERFHGSGDVALSEAGRAQIRAVLRALRGEVFDLVVASPLRRSWQSARILAGSAPVRLEAAFREIDFGRWEGLAEREIAASDPILHRDWRAGAPGFEYPGGEKRAEFRARVQLGLERLRRSGARSVLGVLHKGVIRALAEELLAAPLEDGAPSLGARVEMTRDPSGRWFQGRRSSEAGTLLPLAFSEKAKGNNVPA